MFPLGVLKLWIQSCEKNTPKLYLSNSKDILLKYCLSKSVSCPHKEYLSESLKETDINSTWVFELIFKH